MYIIRPLIHRLSVEDSRFTVEDIGRCGTARDSIHVDDDDKDEVEELIPKATAAV